MSPSMNEFFNTIWTLIIDFNQLKCPNNEYNLSYNIIDLLFGQWF